MINRKPHSINLLNSIKLFNVYKLNKFNKHNYYYNGFIYKNKDIIINIEKQNPYSKLIIISQYYTNKLLSINHIFNQNNNNIIIPSITSTITDNSLLNSLTYQKLIIKSISEDNKNIINYIYILQF